MGALAAVVAAAVGWPLAAVVATAQRRKRRRKRRRSRRKKKRKTWTLISSGDHEPRPHQVSASRQGQQRRFPSSLNILRYRRHLSRSCETLNSHRSTDQRRRWPKRTVVQSE